MSLQQALHAVMAAALLLLPAWAAPAGAATVPQLVHALDGQAHIPDSLAVRRAAPAAYLRALDGIGKLATLSQGSKKFMGLCPEENFPLTRAHLAFSRSLGGFLHDRRLQWNAGQYAGGDEAPVTRHALALGEYLQDLSGTAPTPQDALLERLRAGHDVPYAGDAPRRDWLDFCATAEFIGHELLRENPQAKTLLLQEDWSDEDLARLDAATFKQRIELAVALYSTAVIEFDASFAFTERQRAPAYASPPGTVYTRSQCQRARSAETRDARAGLERAWALSDPSCGSQDLPAAWRQLLAVAALRDTATGSQPQVALANQAVALASERDIEATAIELLDLPFTADGRFAGFLDQLPEPERSEAQAANTAAHHFLASHHDRLALLLESHEKLSLDQAQRDAWWLQQAYLHGDLLALLPLYDNYRNARHWLARGAGSSPYASLVFIAASPRNQPRADALLETLQGDPRPRVRARANLLRAMWLLGAAKEGIPASIAPLLDTGIEQGLAEAFLLKAMQLRQAGGDWQAPLAACMQADATPLLAFAPRDFFQPKEMTSRGNRCNDATTDTALRTLELKWRRAW